ncbi:hypothetical protein Q9X96_000129 [Vibrio vulnificus]|nr:hypothetical protein [Vibrio vulnificus]
MINNGWSFTASNLREYRFFWQALTRDGLVLPAEPSLLHEYKVAIQYALELKFYNKDAREQYAQRIRNSMHSTLVPQDEIEWLEKGTVRSAFWMWNCCRLINSSESPVIWNTDKNKLDIYSEQHLNQITLYTELGLSMHPRTDKERRRLTIEFLDRSPFSIDQKRQLIDYWKEEWGNLYTLERFGWVNLSDTELCEWFSNYLFNNTEFNIPYDFMPTPTSSEERAITAIAAFDIWKADENTKKLFLLRVKKAWGQKKHRASLKKKDKKSYNFTLAVESKQLLDELAENLGVTKNECLEKLIKHGHSNPQKLY